MLNALNIEVSLLIYRNQTTKQTNFREIEQNSASLREAERGA